MDKVKITRKQANALEDMKSKGIPIGDIVERHVEENHVRVNGYEHILEMNTDALIRTLYIGYEIEETPEDKVRKYYHSLKRDEDWEPNEYQRACGVIMTLDLLGIKIEGVNHE